MMALANPFTLLVRLNAWRESVLESAIKRLLDIYLYNDPEGFAGFLGRWLQPRLFNLPNLISFGRMLAVIPLLLLINADHGAVKFWPIGLFALIALSDMLDGSIAKAANCQTVLGANIDPLADRLLVIGVMITQNSYFQILISELIWLMVAGDLVFLATRLYRVIKKIEPFGSNLIGKTKFVLQIAVVIIMLFQMPWALYANAILLICTLLVYYNTLASALTIARFHFGKTAPALPPPA